MIEKFLLNVCSKEGGNNQNAQLRTSKYKSINTWVVSNRLLHKYQSIHAAQLNFNLQCKPVLYIKKVHGLQPIRSFLRMTW